MGYDIVAVPSMDQGGLDGTRADHFGHCEVFTLVTMEQGEIQEVQVIQNRPHNKGGCTAPVDVLADNNVSALIVSGIGARPLSLFNGVGVDVFFDGKSTTVSGVIKKFAEGSLPQIMNDQVCVSCDQH